jgi:SsrA-binding protein
VVPKETGRKVIAQNRRARHDYTIVDVYEAGLVLGGTEVKSLRLGRASLTDAYASIEDGEAWLLLHKDEIQRLLVKTRESGLTIIPLQLYFLDGRAKVEIGLAKGKKAYDHRQDMASRDSQREIARELGRRRKGMVS